MKSTYKSLEAGLNDLLNNERKTLTKRQKAISAEFIRLNDDNVPKDTELTAESIPINSDYKKGDIIASTPYVEYIYYGTDRIPAGGLTGEGEWFEFTYEQNEDHLLSLYEKDLEDNL